MLIFPLAIAGGIAGIALEKQQLTDPFVGIDPTISTGAVAELQR